jgi:ABC-type sugar transport system substrate-binding protein
MRRRPRSTGGNALTGHHPFVMAAIAASMVAAIAFGGTAWANNAPTTSKTISSATISTLKATVTLAEAVPTFTSPGGAVSAKVVKGAGALVMPVNSEIDACQTQAEDFKALGATLGMNVTLFSDSGSPTQWVQGVQDATAAHDKAIALLCGIVPGAIGPSLETAEKDGIKVVDGNYNEVSNYSLLDGETAVQVIQGMTDDVDDAIVNLNGAPIHALLVSSESIVQGPASITAVTSEIHRVCASTCSVAAQVIVPIQDWATQTQSEVGSALVAHPNINAVIVAFDGMTSFVLPALTQAKRAGLKIYTWGGSRSVEKLMLSSTSLVAADPGPDEQWDAYEAMDQVIRLLAGKPAASVNNEIDPNRFFVPSNVKSFFGPNDTYGNGGFGGNAFINGFDKIWGLS